MVTTTENIFSALHAAYLDIPDKILLFWQWLCYLQAEGYRPTDIGISRMFIVHLVEMSVDRAEEIVNACRNVADILELVSMVPHRFEAKIQLLQFKFDCLFGKGLLARDCIHSEVVNALLGKRVGDFFYATLGQFPLLNFIPAAKSPFGTISGNSVGVTRTQQMVLESASMASSSNEEQV